MHRWSELFILTLREAPADAEVASHKFLVRAGYIRQLAAGIYSYLFLGNRSFNKIIGIVREEMGQDRPGVLLARPRHPREIWAAAAGRWTRRLQEFVFRLKDRKGADLALGMTEEEVTTSIAMKELQQTVAADLVPDRSEVSRRAAAEVRVAASATVHDEGLVLV